METVSCEVGKFRGWYGILTAQLVLYSHSTFSKVPTHEPHTDWTFGVLYLYLSNICVVHLYYIHCYRAKPWCCMWATCICLAWGPFLWIWLTRRHVWYGALFVGLFYTPTFLLRCLKGPIMLMGFNSMELGLTILMLVWVWWIWPCTLLSNLCHFVFFWYVVGL